MRYNAPILYNSSFLSLKTLPRFQPRLVQGILVLVSIFLPCIARGAAPQTPILSDSVNAPVVSQKTLAILEAAEGPSAPDLIAIQSGLAAMLLNDIAASPDIRVVSRELVSNSLDEIRLGEAGITAPQTAQRLGKALQANILLELKLTGSPNQFAASLQVLSPNSGEPTWRQTFTGQGEDLSALEQPMLTALRQHLGLTQPVTKGQQPSQPVTLAVFDFLPAGSESELDKYGADLADLLTSYLSGYNSLQLVERQRLADLMQEQAVIAMQNALNNQAQLGRLLGAQRFLYTTMVQWHQQVRFVSRFVEPQTGLISATVSSQGPIEKTAALLQELARQIAGQSSVTSSIPQPATTLTPSTDMDLEVTLHMARGYKLMRMPDYEGAIAEFEKAAFLAPNNGSCWYVLVEAYEKLQQYDKAAGYAETFLARGQANSPDDAYWLRYKLARVEEASRNWAGLEATVRALLADSNEEATENKLISSSIWLSNALLRQGKWAEALRETEKLAASAKYDKTRGEIWRWLLSNLSTYLYDALRNNDQHEPAPGTLAITRKIVEALPSGNSELDREIAPSLFWPLLRHCLGDKIPAVKLYSYPPRDLNEGLEIVELAAEKFKNDIRLPAIALMTKAMLLARLDRPEEALSALNKALQDYPTADVDTWDYYQFSPPMNGMIHFYAGLINEHSGRRAEAAAAFAEAEKILYPDLVWGRWAFVKARDYKVPFPPQAPWEKRVYQIPQFYFKWLDHRFVDWLRTHHYQFWGEYWDNTSPPLGTMGTLIIQCHGGDQMIESLATGVITPDDLRAWVAQGGRLLFLNAYFDYWSEAANRRKTLDQTLNRFLAPFGGMMMHPAAGWTNAEKKVITPTGHPLTKSLPSFEYSGEWWPLICSDDAAVLRLQTDAGQEVVVAAAKQFGLGRVAVITLRNWFPSGGTLGRVETQPADWEEPLLNHLMEWLTEVQNDLEKQKTVERFAKVWRAFIAQLQNKSTSESLKQFEALGTIPGQAGEAARYKVAYASFRQAVSMMHLIMNDKINMNGKPIPLPIHELRQLAADSNKEPIQRAASLFQQLALAGSDPWIRGKSTLGLAKLVALAGRAKEAQMLYQKVAQSNSDILWANAMLGLGALALDSGDYQQAEHCFREVANGVGHSSERLRALFGLGYAIEKQPRLGDAARIYRVIDAQYGGVLISTWLSDPENEAQDFYYPPKSWPQGKEWRESVVSDVVKYRLKLIE